MSETEEVGFSGLRPGTVFGRYEIIRCVGVGGMGSVFEAEHTLLRKKVAIKVLHIASTDKMDWRTRFVQEAETIARIKHRNVVDISDVGILDGLSYYVMEFLDGETLGETLERVGRLTGPQMASIMVPIVAGLASVHREGIIHRDLKPENIFLAWDEHGQVVPKLVDFGVSKDLANAVVGSHHTVVGTPYYMAPEQARGSLTLDARVDQYGVGVVMYQLLTGVVPFDCESLLELMNRIDRGDCAPIRDVVPEVDQNLADIVASAMAPRADARFASCDELARALFPFADRSVQSLYALELRVSVPEVARPSGDSGGNAGGLAPPRRSSVSAVRSRSRAGSAASPGTWDGMARTASKELVRARTGSGVHTPVMQDRESRAAPSRRVAAIVGGFAVLGMLVGGAVAFGRRGVNSRELTRHQAVGAAAPPAPTPTYRARFDVAPTTAIVELDGRVVGNGGLDRDLPRDGTPHVVLIRHDGYASQEIRFVDAAPSGTIRLEAEPTQPASAHSTSRDYSRRPSTTTPPAEVSEPRPQVRVNTSTLVQER